MQTHKCIILSSEIRQSCRPMEYGIYNLIHILVDTGDIVTKIIHEPLYYANRYRLQVFSRYEKKVVPMSTHYQYILQYTEERRVHDTRILSSLVLGFVDYTTYDNQKPAIIPVSGGRVFYAYFYKYKGKDTIGRYYSNGTRNDEVYPDPFEIGENLDYLHSKIV